MKKKKLWILIASALVLALGVGTTLALLVATPSLVKNTFTVGNVDITLTETTGTEYLMAPGVALMKDPTITVKKGSDPCWLFVTLEIPAGFNEFCTFEMDSGWTALEGVSGVYYREVERADVNRVFKVLRNDRVYVKDTVTEEQLNALTGSLDLIFTAGAIQRTGIDTPAEAWNILKS